MADGHYPDAGFAHNQPVASATWTINHHLGRMPAVVSAVDSSGLEIHGALTHPSADQSVLTFSAPQSGKARAI